MTTLLFLLALASSIALPALAIVIVLYRAVLHEHHAYVHQVRERNGWIRHQLAQLIEPGDFKEGE